MRRPTLSLAALLLAAASAVAQEQPAGSGPGGPAPPPGAEAANKPNDWGGTIRVEWLTSPAEQAPGFSCYRVYRSASAGGPWELLSEETATHRWEVAPRFRFFDDESAGDGEWFYQVRAVAGGVEGEPATTETAAKAEAEWFNVGPGDTELARLHAGRYKNLLAVFLFGALILGWVWAAGRRASRVMSIGFFALAGLYSLVLFQTVLPAYLAVLPVLVPIISILIPAVMMNRKLYIRPIPAIQAVEEAIGRATEMGKPILYVPGISSIEDVATLASLNILASVAEKAAQYDSKLIVPNYDPIVFTVTQEVVKEAYLKAGRPDAYSDENVFFLTARQFAYVAAVNGIMVREKPATNFFLGMFYAESLLLAETGNLTGAIQIAGTDAVTQLPFFIVACDYTLIGEELYAAGAYMGGDPRLTGSLKGQDWNKAIAIACLLLFAGLFVVLGIAQDPAEWPKWIRELPAKIFEVRQQ